jgi:hypothetical protein
VSSPATPLARTDHRTLLWLLAITGKLRLLEDREEDYQLITQNRGAEIWVSVKETDSPARKTMWERIGRSLSPLVLDKSAKKSAESKSAGKGGDSSGQSSARSPDSPGGGLVHLRDKETCRISGKLCRPSQCPL